MPSEPLLMEMTRADYEALPIRPVNGSAEIGVAYRSRAGDEPAIWIEHKQHLEYQPINIID